MALAVLWLRVVLAAELASVGAKVLKTLSKRIDVFVQGYNYEDDDRLAQAMRLGIVVVPEAYVRGCLAAGCVLDWRRFALVGALDGSMDDNAVAGYFGLDNQALMAHFPHAPRHVREDEELPQHVCEFEVMDRVAPQPGTKDVFAIMPIVTRKPGTGSFAQSWGKATFAQLGGKVQMKRLVAFVKVFFGMQVRIEPPAELDNSARSCKDGTVDLIMGKYAYPLRVRKVDGRAAVHAMDAIAVLDENIPQDAFCLVGIFADDLYEADDDEDVSGILLGRATGNGSAVVSTAHFGGAATRAGFAHLLGTLAHEASHMFGLDHCPFHLCIMNAMLPDESDPDSGSLGYCPYCLRKMDLAVASLDPSARYAALASTYAALGLDRHASWIDSIMDACHVPQLPSAPSGD
ncbi:uncharacterized protein AMSG_12259 [Thecamonas trahens ATCC 50062]|uniref:BRCT domain-containing protein n=1 Tax=Thecamonas trahens ATCC 50062 TaxID=461836 RepID=A0A0L0DLI1_THETB|nr:hypothetical protein AMSG_12259 [Thecamonas trahens ATCC 50062]KNC53095.1 hypothetical protein AMSG_12259 [Thecamonas trahens ATCC 50062]|eukprot:XP_013754807.1 hypothetical protein AMSG_12259 [Thecamonas trahens ATCC 50062]